MAIDYDAGKIRAQREAELLELQHDPQSSTVRKAADEALVDILSLEIGIENDRMGRTAIGWNRLPLYRKGLIIMDFLGALQTINSQKTVKRANPGMWRSVQIRRKAVTIALRDNG